MNYSLGTSLNFLDNNYFTINDKKTVSQGIEEIIDQYSNLIFRAEDGMLPEEDPFWLPKIDRVIFNNPATIVYWNDGSKTVVKCQNGDHFAKDVGLAMCIAKKALGNKGNFNEVLKKWCGN